MTPEELALASDTPRTNAKLLADDWDYSEPELLPAEFARELERELAALRAKRGTAEQDAKDAARYRWLRECDTVSLERGQLWLVGISNLDAAIDAAMSPATSAQSPTSGGEA